MSMISYSSFIDYLRYEKRSSEHTVTAYSRDLEQFARYMEESLGIGALQDVTADDIRTWIITMLEDSGDTARTVNRKLSALKAFYRHEVKVGAVTDNPMRQVRSPKFQKRLPVYVEQRDMEHLFSDVEFGEEYEGVRDRLVLEMFYATGMRLSELLNLRKNSIDFTNNTLKVLGKRNKERIIPFGNKLRDLLTTHIGNYEKKFGTDIQNYYIFVAANGKKLYPKAIYRIVRKYLDMVTSIDKRSPHVIRHTFATHMLNNGADLNAIKEILGHGSLAATQVYTHNSMEQLKSIYKQAHPRA